MRYDAKMHAASFLPLLARQYSAADVLIWLGAIVALALLLAGLAMALRRRLLHPHDNPAMGFTLNALRDLHAQGKLSSEELAVAEQELLAKSRAAYLGPDDPAGEAQDLGHLGGDEDVESAEDRSGTPDRP